MLVANAWREHVAASQGWRRAVARFSVIATEARALGLVDPLAFPSPLFGRWMRAVTAVASWHTTELHTFTRHSTLERCYRRARLRASK